MGITIWGVRFGVLSFFLSPSLSLAVPPLLSPYLGLRSFLMHGEEDGGAGVTPRHTHTLSLSDSLSLSLSHTHTHTHSLSLSFCLSLSHTHINTHSHTHCIWGLSFRDQAPPLLDPLPRPHRRGEGTPKPLTMRSTLRSRHSAAGTKAPTFALTCNSTLATRSCIWGWSCRVWGFGIEGLSNQKKNTICLRIKVRVFRMFFVTLC